MRTLLVPVDGSEPAERAVEYARETFPESTVVLLTVVDPVHGFEGAEEEEGEWHESATEQAERLQADHADELTAAGLTVETAVRTGTPADEILKAVEEFDADEVVVGSHGREGLGRLLLGSVAESTARRSPVPVTVVR